MRTVVAIAVLSVGLTSWSCLSREKTKEESSSGFSQLTDQNFKCQVDSARTQAIKNKISSMPTFIRGWSDSKREEIYAALALIPDEYLEYLYGLNTKSGFYIGQKSAGSGGVTQLKGNGEIEWPESILLSTTIDIEYGLPHEVGHAVEPYVIAQGAKKAGMSWWDFRRQKYNVELKKAQNEAASNPKVRNYARNQDEFFPEIFANWFCSPAAKNFVANLGPSAIGFNFMTNYVLPSLFDSGDNTNAPALSLIKGSANPSNEDLMAMIATDKEADQVMLCNDDLSICKQNPISIVPFKRLKEGSERNFFVTTQVFYATDENLRKPWTLLSLKADKTVLKSITVNLSK